MSIYHNRTNNPYLICDGCGDSAYCQNAAPECSETCTKHGNCKAEYGTKENYKDIDELLLNATRDKWETINFDEGTTNHFCPVCAGNSD